MQRPTPKTYLFTATQQPVTAVFYRRSRLLTYVLKLNAKYCLELGARFVGRLFPERSALSPDGKYLIYFAMRGVKGKQPDDPRTWTAISELPSLTGLVFCPNGSTYGGGGIFLEPDKLLVLDNLSVRDKRLGKIRLVTVSDLSAEEKSAVEQIRLRKHEDVILRNPFAKGKDELPCLRRLWYSGEMGEYNRSIYSLQMPDGAEVKNAELVRSCDWAGWDCTGRLLVAKGHLIHVFDVRAAKALPDPIKVIDIEAAIHSKVSQ